MVPRGHGSLGAPSSPRLEKDQRRCYRCLLPRVEGGGGIRGGQSLRPTPSTPSVFSLCILRFSSSPLPSTSISCLSSHLPLGLLPPSCLTRRPHAEAGSHRVRTCKPPSRPMFLIAVICMWQPRSRGSALPIPLAEAPTDLLVLGRTETPAPEPSAAHQVQVIGPALPTHKRLPSQGEGGSGEGTGRWEGMVRTRRRGEQTPQRRRGGDVESCHVCRGVEARDKVHRQCPSHLTRFALPPRFPQVDALEAAMSPRGSAAAAEDLGRLVYSELVTKLLLLGDCVGGLGWTTCASWRILPSCPQLEEISGGRGWAVAVVEGRNRKDGGSTRQTCALKVLPKVVAFVREGAPYLLKG